MVQNQKKKKLKFNKKERNLSLQTILFNKYKDTIILENLENVNMLIKTKNFINVCNKCNINYNSKLLVIVYEKTMPLKLSTKNLKNVELISAKNLNIISIIKAKKLLITTIALNLIKEVYCG